MVEQEQIWKLLEAEIKCPRTNGPCMKDEVGVRRNEDFLSHSAIVDTVECNFCGSRAIGWGER